MTTSYLNNFSNKGSNTECQYHVKPNTEWFYVHFWIYLLELTEADARILTNEGMEIKWLSKGIVLARGEAVLDPDLTPGPVSSTITLYIPTVENDLTQTGETTKTSNSKTKDNIPLLFCTDTNMLHESTFRNQDLERNG